MRYGETGVSGPDSDNQHKQGMAGVRFVRSLLRKRKNKVVGLICVFLVIGFVLQSDPVLSPNSIDNLQIDLPIKRAQHPQKDKPVENNHSKIIATDVKSTHHNGSILVNGASNMKTVPHKVPGAPKDVNFIINNPNLCADINNIEIIVYFTTAPDQFERRSVIRSTWTNDDVFPKRIMGRVFLIGTTRNENIQKKLEAESHKHQDVVQGDFMDSYKELSQKGVMALKWISTYCTQAKFAIKSDDDAFVNIYALAAMLEAHKDTKRAIFGNCWGYGEKVTNRDRKSKWYLSEKQLPEPFFPDYCIGLLYVITVDIIPEMYQVAKATPLVHIEDLYMTGILPKKIGNVKHIGFIKNFGFSMVSCQARMRQMKNVKVPFGHMVAECPKDLAVMWKLYSDRVKSPEGMKLFTDHVIENSCTVADVPGALNHTRACL